MQIKSNKRLLAIIRNHEVGVRYPDLIPYIACNIVIQKDNSIFSHTFYRYFDYWFCWANTREGHDYWREINRTLISVSNKDD